MAIIRDQGDQDTPISIPAPPSTPSSARSPNYNRRFWGAFSVPPTGIPRYLDPDDLLFHELPEGTSVPERYLLVDQQYIAPERVPDRDALIKNNIRQWLDKNDLKEDRFIGRAAKPAEQNVSLMHSIIDALDKRQLAGVSLPLDVIKSLLEKKP